MGMKLSEFKFDLPADLIALHPKENRDDSRLMVIHKDTGEIEHKVFKDVVPEFVENVKELSRVTNKKKKK